MLVRTEFGRGKFIQFIILFELKLLALSNVKQKFIILTIFLL